MRIAQWDILQYVLDSPPTVVSANGVSHVRGAPENMAHLTVYLQSGAVANLNVNWLAPLKVRQVMVGGSRKMIVYNDLEPSEKIKVYDKGVTLAEDPDKIYQMRVGYRAGDMWAPQLDHTEALQTEARHFLECIEKNKQPETDGAAGLRMVNMIEAAEISLRDRGRLVEIQW